MSGWSLFWLVLGVFAAGGELVALVRKQPGDTLSEQVWRWLKVTPGHTTLRTAVMSFRTLLVVAVLAWLIPHFTLGWFT